MSADSCSGSVWEQIHTVDPVICNWNLAFRKESKPPKMASTIPRRAPAYFTRSGGVDRRLFERVRLFIETRADAERNRTRNLRSLTSAGNFPRLMGRMFRCDNGAPCEELLCSRCARRYRLWLAGQCLRFVVEPVEAHIVTILLVAVGGGLLHTVDVRAEHHRLRKRLIRSGVRSAIGGTEATYEAPNDRWVRPRPSLGLRRDQARDRATQGDGEEGRLGTAGETPTRSRPGEPSDLFAKIRDVPSPGQGERRRQGVGLPFEAAPRRRVGALVRAPTFRRFRLFARLSPPRFAHRRGALVRRHCR